MKICNNCHAELADSVNFCHLCGGSQFSAAAAAPVEPSNETEPLSPPDPIPQKNPDPTPAYIPGNGYYTDNGAPVQPPRKKASKGLIIGIISGVVALVAVSVVLVILMNPVTRFMRAIQKGDIVTAAEIYFDSIVDSSDRMGKLNDNLASYADEHLQKYLNGEISYDEMSEQLWAVNSAGVFNDDIYAAINQASNVDYWRRTYEEANEALSNGDYANAILLYCQVLDDEFENVDAAVEKLQEASDLYRNEVVEAVAAYTAEHNYESAYALLNNALEILSGDSTLLKAYDDCVAAEYTYTIDCIIEEAQVYYNTNDYQTSLAYLDDYICVYPDEVRLHDERNSCLTQYEHYVVTEAFRLAKEGSFNHALSLIESAQAHVTSSTITNLQLICISHIPVNLGDMEIFLNETKGGSWASYTNEKNEYLTDNYNNTYSHSLSAGCGKLTYLVNFKYQSFTGTVAFPKGLTADNARKSATLTIYGDDQELVVFQDVTADTKPQSFELDITGYEKIVLKWTCDGYNVWSDWGEFATIFNGVLTPIPLDLPESIS